MPVDQETIIDTVADIKIVVDAQNQVLANLLACLHLLRGRIRTLEQREARVGLKP